MRQTFPPVIGNQSGFLGDGVNVVGEGEGDDIGLKSVNYAVSLLDADVGRLHVEGDAKQCGEKIIADHDSLPCLLGTTNFIQWKPESEPRIYGYDILYFIETPTSHALELRALMKIHHLPNGARFEYEGEEYVKTGPLFASGKGGQRLIPKYAVLKPLGDVQVVPEKPAPDSLSRGMVLAAVEAFYTECKALVPESRQPEMDAARVRCMSAFS